MRTTRRTLLAAGTLLACLFPVGAHAQHTSSEVNLPSDAGIRRMLAERITAIAGSEDGIGIVVGIIGPQGRKIASYGHFDQKDRRPLGGNTAFEIASVTKVFTALLLADMVQRGEVALDDPVAKYLPADVKLPERNGRAITLSDLATHTSGLPFMPDTTPVFSDSPATKYISAQLYEFLARYRLSRDIGSDWDYSNINYWLLSEALAHRAGLDYETLLRTRVLARLKMQNTAITVPPRIKAKLAVGHNAVLQPAPPFSALSVYAIMPAAGGLVSTVNDLLTFLSATMGYQRSPLTPAMATMLATRRPISKAKEQALGWVVEMDSSGTDDNSSEKNDDPLILHDGGSWGYASCVAWDPKSRVGVVVLSNQVADVSDLSRHLLRPSIPLQKATLAQHIEIALNPEVLDSYAGQYDAEEEVFNIVREAGFLTLQLPTSWGLPKFRLRPETSHDFFVAELPIRVTFRTAPGGPVTGILVYPPRGQHALPANRVTPAK
jgi:serine-type D-Ala-D-Ala carboxypeptidase/endopeptidase